MPRPIQYALLAISLLFVAAGIGMVATGAKGGWKTLFFFGVCAAVAAAQLWPGLLRDDGRPMEKLAAAFPGPRLLRPSRRKVVFFAIGSAIFAATALSLAIEGAGSTWFTAVMWVGVVFFGAGSVALAASLFWVPSLRLDGEGFGVDRPSGQPATRWSDTSPFVTAKIPPSMAPVVVFDDLRRTGAMAQGSMAFAGRNTCLVDSYGLPPDELAALLNAWRERALAGR